MRRCVLLSLLLALGCVHVHGAPVEQDGGVEPMSCEDAQVKGAAEQAITKINLDRQEGYVLGLHRLSNAHIVKHGDNGIVFYLTLDVVETNCSVLSRKDWKSCEARPTHDTPVYGQCKAAIFINRPQRVVRLYKYDCAIRPAPAAKVHEICPDCPSHVGADHAEVQKVVTQSLDKYNKESGLANHFALLKITRAVSGLCIQMGTMTHYNVEYTIQETSCQRGTEAVTNEKCPPMSCEFAHKGFCKASLSHNPMGEPGDVTVECEIYEPEAAEKEKKLHLLGGETDHSHSDTTHDHAHDHAHAADHTHTHDHVHDHTKSHAHHDKTGQHADGSEHHHAHDHEGHAHDHSHDHDHKGHANDHDHKGHAHNHSHDHDHKGHAHDHSHDHDHEGHAHAHAHDHSHDHGHGHDHVHAHHAKAHDHTGDFPNQHHDYKHADGVDTHEHDHELALDHDHKHAHLHEHEHHHHHHDHDHETTPHSHPEGTVRMLPAMGQPVTLPSFPDVPAGGPEQGVTLPLKPDPQIPGAMEPTIQAFPTSVSAQCPPPAAGETLVEKLFAEDPMFKAAA